MQSTNKQLKITFEIITRKASPEQKEAGKRLLNRLKNRTILTAKAQAQAVAEATPAVDNNEPPSLTNRGA
jgi:hypothetical protein